MRSSARFIAFGTEPFCFREVGYPTYPGFYFDNDAYDLDLQAMSPAPTGTALPDDLELLTQSVNGILTVGRARTMFGASTNVGVPSLVGAHYDPGGNPGARVFVGIAGIKGGPFPTPNSYVAGTAIQGADNVLHVFTPTAVTGGLRPADRFRVIFDYETMRAWFYVAVPLQQAGDPGFAYDTHPRGAYDAAPFADFYDGAPYADAAFYAQAYQSLVPIRAGGVGYTFFLDDGPCP